MGLLIIHKDEHSATYILGKNIIKINDKNINKTDSRSQYEEEINNQPVNTNQR